MGSRHYWYLAIAVAAPAALIAGCTSRSAVPKLSFNASQAAIDALAQYDSNRDGALAGDELPACPGIKDSLSHFDKNGDGRVDAEELKGRFQVWLDSPTRLLKLLCIVKLDGQPLNGATVSFVPEKFLGEALLPGEGRTGESGMTSVSINSESESSGPPQPRGMRLGLYRVSISHPTVKVPAKYNSETTLGAEVSPTSSGSPMVFSLSSR